MYIVEGFPAHFLARLRIQQAVDFRLFHHRLEILVVGLDTSRSPCCASHPGSPDDGVLIFDFLHFLVAASWMCGFSFRMRVVHTDRGTGR